MTQRLDRVQLGGPPCGHVAEKNADGGGEQKRQQVDARVEQEGQVQYGR